MLKHSATSIILDTDIGTDVDDAVALVLLLASAELDLLAVTTVSGDVQLRARIAKKLLTLGGRADIPVFAGCSDPQRENRNFLWLGHEGKGIVNDDERLSIESTRAVDQLARVNAEIVAIGPLTNVAAGLRDRRESGDASREDVDTPVSHLPSPVYHTVPRITLMGGALGFSEDPTTPPVEYNLGSDAEASVAALSAGIPTTIVPLDVTWQVRLRATDLARLRRSRSTLVQTLCDAMEIWWPVHRDLFEGKRTYGADVVCFLHDPLALSLLIDPSFVTLTSMRLVPEIVDGVFGLRASEDGHEFQVATKVDAPAFVEFVVERLMGLR